MSEPSLDPQIQRFAEDPDDRAAFEFLEEQLFMGADWSGLIDLYRRRSDAPTLGERPRARADLALRIGRVLEERLSDEEAAIQAYTEAIRLDPTLRKALSQLRRIYAARRSWEAVLQIGEQQAALAESSRDRARIFAEMGDIWQREIGDEDHARELYELARNETGASEDPATGETAELVQSAWLSAARGDTDAAVSALEIALERNPADIEALDMMTTVLEGGERLEEVAPLLEQRASVASDPQTRSAVLMRLGEVRERLADLGGARESYERAFDADPRNGAVRQSLSRVYSMLDAWVPLRSLLERSLEGSEGVARVGLLCELGEVLERKFDDPQRARECFDEAAQLDGTSTEAREGIARLDAPQEMLTSPELDIEPRGADQRTDRVLGVLERKLAARISEGEDRHPEAIRLRLRIAELLAGARGDPAAAVETLEPAVQSDSLLEVAPVLSGLYEQLGRLEPLIELAERCAEARLPKEQCAFWQRRAAEAARALGDPERAIAGYRRLLERRPDDRAVRAELCDLYRSRGDSDELRGLLRAELPQVDEAREFEIRLELAALHEESPDGAADCLLHLRRCLQLEPEREDLLERALAAGERAGGALAQLDFLEDAVRRSEDERQRAALLTRRGDLLADSLEWREEAAESWRAALALDARQDAARSRLEQTA